MSSNNFISFFGQTGYFTDETFIFRFLFPSKVLVVLTTDGNDNPLTDAAALRLRQDGVGVFVVGLGKDLDPNVLRNISGDSNQVYVVPNVQRLSTVVRDVITDIGDDRKGICNIYTKIKVVTTCEQLCCIGYRNSS